MLRDYPATKQVKPYHYWESSPHYKASVTAHQHRRPKKIPPAKSRIKKLLQELRPSTCTDISREITKLMERL